MSIFKNIKNVWNLASMCGDIPMYDTLKHLDFFAFTGLGCSSGFCIDLNHCDGIEQAYNECNPLSTIIGRNAQAMVNAKWWITDKKDNDTSDKYTSLQKLLKNPNPIQSWTEFLIQLDTYRQLYGSVFIWAAVPTGLSIQEATALWVIKPSYIDIQLSNKLYFQSDINDIVKKYYLNIGTHRTELNADHLLHIKDTFQNLNFCPTDIKGKSRLIGLEYPIKNIIQAYEAIYALNRDRGAQGILSNVGKDSIGSIPVTPEEQRRIQEEFFKYGLKDRQGKVIITDAALQWQQMSYNVKDLMLFEGLEENIKQIADAFYYPYELLGNTKGVTYANKKEAKKWHYQDAIIPISTLYGEKLTEFFQLQNDFISADFSDIEVLKESESDKAETKKKFAEAYGLLFDKGIISKAEYRLNMGFDEQIYKPDANES